MFPGEHSKGTGNNRAGETEQVRKQANYRARTGDAGVSARPEAKKLGFPSTAPITIGQGPPLHSLHSLHIVAEQLQELQRAFHKKVICATSGSKSRRDPGKGYSKVSQGSMGI